MQRCHQQRRNNPLQAARGGLGKRGHEHGLEERYAKRSGSDDASACGLPTPPQKVQTDLRVLLLPVMLALPIARTDGSETVGATFGI